MKTEVAESFGFRAMWAMKSWTKVHYSNLYNYFSNYSWL